MSEIKLAQLENRGFKRRKGRKKYGNKGNYCSKEQVKRMAEEIEAALEAQRMRASSSRTLPNDSTETASAQANMRIAGMVYDKEKIASFRKENVAKLRSRSSSQ